MTAIVAVACRSTVGPAAAVIFARNKAMIFARGRKRLETQQTQRSYTCGRVCTRA
jgi:hypothetical protein